MNDRLWSWVHRLVAAATVAPLFFSKYLPFSDLPEHLALIATMRHWWDPDWQSQTYFRFEGIAETQYWLYHVVGALLAIPFRSAERAGLFLTVVSGLGFPYALRSLARALDRDPRLGLFGAPLFWNLALAEGLMSYVAAVPVAIWATALAIVQMRAPRRGRGVLVGVLTVTLLYLHLSAFLFFVLAGCGAAVLVVLPLLRASCAPLPERIREGLRRLPWIPIAAALAVLFVWQSSAIHGRAGSHYDGAVRFGSTRRLAGVLFAWMHDFWVSPWDNRLGYVLWAALLGLFVLGVRGLRERKLDTNDRIAAVLAGISLALYFGMPTQIGYAFLLDLRMAPIVGMTLALLVRPARIADGARVQRALFGVVAAVGVLVGVHASVEMHRFERDESAHFDLLLKNLPRGHRLLMLVFQRESRITNVTPFVHYGAYYRARYGGIASFSFTELPHWPLQYQPALAPPRKESMFWDWNPCKFRNSTDGPYYDYVLTRGDVLPFANHPLGPRWIVIGGARDWKLYARQGGTWDGDGIDDGPCGDGRPATATEAGAARDLGPALAKE